MRRYLTTALVVCTCTVALCAPPRTSAAGEARREPSLADRATGALRRAGAYWAGRVASHGGYVWEYGADLVTRRRGESKDLGPDTVWVQPPGTPSVGMAFLRAYEATGEKPHLDAALAAGRCLAWGQLASGGWTYRIDFDPKENRYRYHHLDPETTQGYAKLRNVTTFDDDTTQSATRFLMELDRRVDDPEIDAAVKRALRCFLEAQYRGGKWDGAWPQCFPPSPTDYCRLPTFNDNAMSDCVRTVLLAYRMYERTEYLDAVKRCLEFTLRSQLPEPQSAWAQQYDEDLRPAWARKFEPPAVSGSESRGNMELLLDMFLELGDERYLAAVGKTLEWYRRSRIGGTEEAGIWARFYEPGSNRPLYFTRTYELVFTDDDLPVHYSFKGSYGVNATIRRYAELLRLGRERVLAARAETRSAQALARIAKDLEPRVRNIVDSLDASGRWLRVVAKREQVRDEQGRVGYEVDEATRLEMLDSREFVQNVETLAAYLEASRGHPPARAEGAAEAE